LSWKTMTMCGLIADTTTTQQDVSVKFSDNDSQSFGTARTIDLNLAQKEIYRCGTFRERFVQLTHSGTGEVRFRRFFASFV